MQFFNLITFTGLFLSMCIIVSLSYKVYTLKTLLKQLVLDQKILKVFSETLKDQLDFIKDETDETQEHFIKFLSDSRQVAYDYIEETINAINEIILYCEQQIDQPKLADLYSDAKLKFIVDKLKPLVEQTAKDL
jgi:hypothetical protein